MLDLIAQVLVVGVLLLLPATVLLFTVPSAARERRPSWPPRRSMGLLAAGSVGLAAFVVSTMSGHPPAVGATAALLFGGSVLAWIPVARVWDARGLVAWALTLDVGLLYLVYVLGWTLTGEAGVVGTVLSALLWALEAIVFVFGVGYVWELVDVVARRVWTDPAELRARAAGTSYRPFVSLHVPTHNEPPDMVIETLRHMLALDYDDYEIVVIDNNTTDPALWRPVEAFCAGRDRITFLHVENWPGYKSGALNHALTRTDPRAEVIGIVDADYHVDADWLTDCAPLFGESDVAFVQTPQDYRDWSVSRYFRRLYYSYSYFFDVSQKSRHERNGAIFGGTMGLIRRSALVDSGRWDEWCITEDAELSLRLLAAGGRGIHIDRAYGRGVMPLTFEALKRQRFRWCFGGVQILRMHWRALLPGPRTPENRLTFAQRWAYLVGGLQWFGDLAGLLFTGFLSVGALGLLTGDGIFVRRLSGLLLLAVIGLVVLGAVRSVALVRRSSGASLREALGAFGLWLALGLTVARGAWLGLVSKEGAFLRTPKVRGEPNWRDALRGNRVETALSLVCLVLAGALLAGAGQIAAALRPGGGTAAFGGPALAALLAFQAVGFAAAPLNSLAAIRSELTDEQRRVRAGWRPSWTGLPAQARRGGLAVLGSLVLVGVMVAFAAPLRSPVLDPDRYDVEEPHGPVPGRTLTPVGTPADTSSPGGLSTTPSGPGATPPTVPETTTPPTAGPSPVDSSAPGEPSPNGSTPAEPVPTGAGPTASTSAPTTSAPPPSPSPTAASTPTAQTTTTPGSQGQGHGKPTAKPTRAHEPTPGGGRP